MLIKDAIATWRTKSELVKLQYVYAFVVVVTLVLAGLVGLLNQSVAWSILAVSWVATLAFFVNLITWALVNLFETQTKPQKPTTRSKKS